MARFAKLTVADVACDRRPPSYPASGLKNSSKGSVPSQDIDSASPRCWPAAVDDKIAAAAFHASAVVAAAAGCSAAAALAHRSSWVVA